MMDTLDHRLLKNRTRIAIVAVMALSPLYAFRAAGAKDPAPITPPERATATQSIPVTVAPAQSGAPKNAPSNGALDPPTIPIDQIIQKFAAREEEFKVERENFTYTQTFVIQTLDANGQPDGEYKQVSEIVFTPAGKRFERVVNAPSPTLERISLDQQDLDDLEHVQPFVLTTGELPKYDIKYVDHVRLDELGTYVFEVGPKTIEKNQRYFQGRVWVDDKDFEIVKSDGKAVPDIHKRSEEHLYPRFETFRENIEGDYWFPTYTRSNDILHFSSGDVPIRMTVRYENYKRFGVTVKIGAPTKANQDNPPSK